MHGGQTGVCATDFHRRMLPAEVLVTEMSQSRGKCASRVPGFLGGFLVLCKGSRREEVYLQCIFGCHSALCVQHG